MNSQLKRKAFSLIEAAIVLGIVGLVLGGIWVAATTVSERMALSRDQALVLTIVDKTARLFKQDPNFGALVSAADLQAMGIVTADLVSGGVVKSHSGASIFVVPSMGRQLALR